MFVPKVLRCCPLFKLNFSIHIDHEVKRSNKIIRLLRRLSVCLPIKSLLMTYRFFIRPHLDHGNILYDKPDNQNFESKTKKA